MTEYKPCPFCGEDDPNTGATTSFEDGRYFAYVECGNCGSGTREFVADDPDEVFSMAIEAWNRRA